MRFSVLGSGSKGNSVYIESGTTAILIDAGFSGKEMAARLHSIGRRLEDVDAIFLTHEHQDHIQGAGILSRRCQIPVLSNYGTMKGGEARLGQLHRYAEFETGAMVEMKDLQIRSFAISHDTADPVGFVVDNGRESLGYCTDTGKVSALMRQRLKGCQGLILEFNHDLQMLKDGPYPLALQQRVRSAHGHLANTDAADLLQFLLHERLQWVLLSHLSEVNNHPDLALQAVMSALDTCSDDGGATQFLVASQIRATDLLPLGIMTR